MIKREFRFFMCLLRVNTITACSHDMFIISEQSQQPKSLTSLTRNALRKIICMRWRGKNANDENATKSKTTQNNNRELNMTVQIEICGCVQIQGDPDYT